MLTLSNALAWSTEHIALPQIQTFHPLNLLVPSQCWCPRINTGFVKNGIYCMWDFCKVLMTKIIFQPKINRGYAGGVPKLYELGYAGILPCYEWIRYQALYSNL